MTPDKTNSREDLLKRLMKLNEELGKKGYLLKNILKGMEERGEKLENPLREKVKKVAKDSENAFVTARETLKEFSDKCKGEEQEIDIVGIVDGFQRSTGKDEVESTYLKKSGQFLSDMSKDFGEKLKTLGSKIATNVKDLFGKTKNLCESLSKEHIREIDPRFSFSNSRRLDTIPEKEAVAVKTPHIPKSYTEHKREYWANKNAHKLEYMRGDIKRKQREKSQSKNTHTEREHKKANPSTDRSR